MLSFLLQRVNIIAWKLHFALQAVSKAPGCAHHQFAPIKLSGFSSYFITPPSAKEIFPFAWVASLEKSAQTVQKEALTLNLRTFSICWCARGQWSAPRTIILASAAELSLSFCCSGSENWHTCSSDLEIKHDAIFVCSFSLLASIITTNTRGLKSTIKRGRLPRAQKCSCYLYMSRSEGSKK